jgi:Mg2+ and Co2+ transporter CorA
MTRKTRGLLGTIAIIGLLVVYPLAIAGLFGEMLARVPGWAAILAFAVLGILWFVPAAFVIRWMSRPD